MKKYISINKSLHVIKILVLGIFLFNTIFSGFALAQIKTRNWENLAVQSRIDKPYFKEQFRARQITLSHQAINLYIRSQIERVIRIRGEEGLKKKTVSINGVKTLVISINGLTRKTGQFAHVGLGNYYKFPVIYIDEEFFDNRDVILHEIGEISQWESLRNILGLETDEMRDWIAAHLDLPDNKLSGTPYQGLSARKIARQFHQDSHSLATLYENYKNIDFDFDYIYKLCTLYGYENESNILQDVIISATGGADPKRQVQATWIRQNAPALLNKTIITLSMEGNIPEFGNTPARNANTKGGLGAYYGDKLEGLAAIGMDSIGIQPGYAYVMEKGKPVKVDYSRLIEKGVLEPVLTGKDAITVWAWAEDPLLNNKSEKYGENIPVKVEVYRVNRGGAWDYILISEVFDFLYNENRQYGPEARISRFTQEIVFGKAVYKLVNEMCWMPDILHMNEAHTVVAAAQLRADRAFDKMAIVYTNHTLVPAGMERFFASEMGTNVNRMMYNIGLPETAESKFRSDFIHADGIVDYCKAAFMIADVINAVSEEHALATERLFKTLYGDEFNKKIIPVLNGSGITWKNPALLAIEEEGRMPEEDELWRIHEKAKIEKAFAEIEKKTHIILKPNKPTVWAVRRLVEYKSQYPLLRFLVHLMCADRDKTFTRESLKQLWLRDIPDLKGNNSHRVYNRDIHKKSEYILDRLFEGRDHINGLGMQLVLGGPEYEKGWAAEFINWTNKIPEIKGNLVYVPNSDAELLKMQAIGADICITIPRPLEEACGTSDQRTALNGGVNIAINGAGPKEWMTEYDELQGTGSGFFIGSYTIETESGLIPDNNKFYREAPVDLFKKLEVSSRLYYDDKAKWKHLMRNSYAASNFGSENKKAVTAKAMEERYARDVYLPAVERSTPRKAEGHSAACLETLYRNANFSDNPITLSDLVKRRRLSRTTVRTELSNLISIGLVKVDTSKRPYKYYLSEKLRALSTNTLSLALGEIYSIPELTLYKIPEGDINAIKLRIDNILALSLAAEKEVASIKELLDEVVPVQLEQDRKYVVKYDTARLSHDQISIIEEYIKVMQLRAANPDNIKDRPFSSLKGSKESLVAVYCTGEDFKGEGHVDVSVPEGNIEEYLLKIVSMLNIALAASNLPAEASEEDAGRYRYIINFIKNQYRLITGNQPALPKGPKALLRALRYIVLDLPKTDKMPLDQIDDYNRMMRQALIAA